MLGCFNVGNQKGGSLWPIRTLKILSKHLSDKGILSKIGIKQLKPNNIKTKTWDFPDGPVVENLPANAGDMCLIPDPGRSHMPRGNEAHVPQLLSLSSGARALQQEKPPHGEARAL